MSATDELNRMLDERGIEHYVAEDESWIYVCEEIPGMYSCNIQERPDGLLNVHIHGSTPAKAIEVMLGRGECCNTQDDFDFMCSE